MKKDSEVQSDQTREKSPSLTTVENVQVGGAMLILLGATVDAMQMNILASTIEVAIATTILFRVTELSKGHDIQMVSMLGAILFIGKAMIEWSQGNSSLLYLNFVAASLFMLDMFIETAAIDEEE